MSLDNYRKKRNFNKTPEPKGLAKQPDTHTFVIQKHAASHLHYDFRLELNGVLKSWAIPKGPCLDSNVKRLAMHVEDHPIEYGSFEGIIPKGQYGGGTVMLWDQGIWVPLDPNPTKAYLKGHLHFELQGTKLHGTWDLIRFKKDGKAESWLLKKSDDNFSAPLLDCDIIKREPNSVVSGKSIEELTQNYDAIWESGGETIAYQNEKRLPRSKRVKLNLPIKPFPHFIPPQLATLVDSPPAGDQWLHEVKFDGYRILAFKQGNDVQLLSRNNKNWTHQFTNIVDEINKIKIKNIVFDGEIVLLDKDGRSNFQLLQNSKKNKGSEYVYYVFDLLYYDKWEIQSLSLLERKKLLVSELLNKSNILRYSDHVIGDGLVVFKKACQSKLEGIVSKRIDSGYITKRSKSWLKSKCVKRQEFVIGGFSPPQGARDHFGSLYLGVYDKEQFIFCGNVGTGFTTKSLTELYSKLKPIITASNPFSIRPPGIKTATWVQPKLVAEVEFSEWTQEGRLRHPSFKGLREDKAAVDVI